MNQQVTVLNKKKKKQKKSSIKSEKGFMGLEFIILTYIFYDYCVVSVVVVEAKGLQRVAILHSARQ